MKRLNCYIYTRVSTSMQVEGFSLDAQREKLRKYAEYQEMHIAGEYSDEGKSGKNIGGRLAFQQMLSDIASGKDSIDYVLVFKLSRFGRNAADVLSSLQIMQDYGANLICVEDGIDSSKDSGKLMISVLSAVAEIERENILVQTMEGRKQKAREGKWNGGFAPYGYYLEKGELKIAEDEAETIRIIFDKYINTNLGANGIAKYLNQHGIAKKPRQNGTLDTFSAHFIKLVIQNPVYCGKIAFGRRKTEKINGTRNEYHIVKQEQYPIYDGIHEAIVSVEDWELAQQKRKKLGVKREKIYNLDHEHLLSGLLRCPVCGAAMYGNINRKKKPDGTIYKDHFYYACKHRMRVDGHKCDYHRQWNQTVVNGAVEEVIERLVSNPEFEKALCEKINTRVSTEGLEEELAIFKKQLNQLVMSKRKLASQMDTLDVTDRHYDKKYQDMQNRLYDFYDEIEVVEEQIAELQSRIANIKEEKISGENVYLFLHYYGTMYKEFTDAEKKKFLNTFIESVEIFKEEQPDGRLLKCINFKFPVFYDGDENVTHICWDSQTTVEICDEVRGQLKQRLTKEELQKTLNKFGSLANNPVIKIVPNFIKLPVIRMMQHKSHSANTTIITNTGESDISDRLKERIERVDGVNGDTSGYGLISTCSVVSGNGLINLCFSVCSHDVSWPKECIIALAEQGIDIRVEGTNATEKDKEDSKEMRCKHCGIDLSEAYQKCPLCGSDAVEEAARLKGIKNAPYPKNSPIAKTQDIKKEKTAFSFEKIKAYFNT